MQIQNALEQLVKTYKSKEDEFNRFQKDFNIQVSFPVFTSRLSWSYFVADAILRY